MESTAAEYRRTRMQHWDRVARRFGCASRLGGYYHRRLAEIYRQIAAPGLSVLEIGCAQGNLLAALEPSFGVGVDFSHEMLARARNRHPNLHFIQADAHELALGRTFDIIVVADLINDVWDVQRVLERLRPMTTPRTRIILNFFSRLWEKPLNAGRRAGLAQPLLEQNWLALEDMVNLLRLSGFEMVRQWEEILWPLRTPGIDSLMNRLLVRFFPFRHGALTHVLVARPEPARESTPDPVVSVIVPARNEEGNIPSIFQRVPEMGAGTELIFVEGHSKDETYAAIERAISANPHRRAKLLRQTGAGKADAMRLGFAQATGQIMMILDADLTVPPEDLPRFYEALRANRGEFVNGVRLIYPMEKGSMQFLNLVANKLFGLAFSWLLGQSIRDTLCGTKALSRDDYDKISRNRKYFGDFDPFGDFDLLFGAAKLNLRIIDIPIRYRERTYGSTNIRRFSHGLLLLRMVFYAARKIKFV